MRWRTGERILCLSLDAGTVTFNSYFQLVEATQKLTPDFRLDYSAIRNPDWRIPALAAISTDGDHPKLVFDPTTVRHLSGASLHPNDIFRLLKLELLNASNGASQDQIDMVGDSQRRNADIIARFRRNGALPQGIKSSLDVLQSYLAYFWDLVVETMRRKFPMLTKDELQHALKHHTRIVVGVPEKWPQLACNKFRSMLSKAGFPHAHLRPEGKLCAAAVAKRQQDNHIVFSPDDHRYQTVAGYSKILRAVLDLGGGTSDLAAVLLLRLYPVLLFSSLTPGDGDMSGGEYLNHVFRVHSRRALTPHMDHISSEVGLPANDIIESLVQAFEREKRDFVTRGHMPMKLLWEPVGDCERGLPRLTTVEGIELGFNFVRFPWTFTERVFDKYMFAIFALVDKQLKQVGQVNDQSFQSITIHLVGGSSRIPYVCEQVRNKYNNSSIGNYNITVDQAEEDRSLVAEGGLLACMDETLGKQEYARTSYGVALTVPYNDRNAEHSADFMERERTPSWLDWEYELHKRWFPMVLEMTNLLDTSSKTYHDDQIELAADKLTWPFFLKQKIYQCTDRELAEKLDWSIRQHPTKVSLAAKFGISVNASDVNWPVRTKNGKRFYRLHFRIRTEWDGMCEKFHFFVSRSGKPIRTPDDEKAALSNSFPLWDLPAKDTMEGTMTGEASHPYSLRNAFSKREP